MNYRTLDVDARKYFQLTRASLLATRFRGFWSGGEDPQFFAFGGQGDFRGVAFNKLTGTRGFYGNAELRFPLVDLLATPIVHITGIRGTAFFDLAGAWYGGQTFKLFADRDGWGLGDSRASMGLGTEVFLGGLPLHFDWAWPTDLRSVDDAKFEVWIGFDY